MFYKERLENSILVMYSVLSEFVERQGIVPLENWGTELSDGPSLPRSLNLIVRIVGLRIFLGHRSLQRSSPVAPYSDLHVASASRRDYLIERKWVTSASSWRVPMEVFLQSSVQPYIKDKLRTLVAGRALHQSLAKAHAGKVGS